MDTRSFWSRVVQSDVGCWEWLGNIATHGYGRVWFGRQRWRVHRLAYVLAYGPIPDGVCVLHHCDKRSCVRPEHLWLGSTAENSRDMVNKGRSVHLVGEQKGTSKLCTREVLEIRALRTQEWPGNLAVARRFGVSTTTIKAIVRRKIWSHLP